MSSDNNSQLLIRLEAGIATLTLNRPERMNALGVAIVEQLLQALEVIEADPGVRVLILTSAGERAFCTGADLKERAAMDADARWAHNRALNMCADRLAGLQIPSIAAVNGLALGGGCEISLACDFRIAAEHAVFALPEVGLGIIPGAGGTQRLPRLIGPVRAKELIFTARRIGADQALEWGLVSQVVPQQQLIQAACDFASSMAQHSPLALDYAKAAIDVGLEIPLEQGLRYETAAIRACLSAEDYQIGLAAFAAKQKPVFPDRRG